MTTEAPVRRIVVGLDCSPQSGLVLERALEAAVRFGVEVLGLYVEDLDLLNLPDTSLSQEIGMFSGTTRVLESRQLERVVRAQASRSRRSLAEGAERAQVRWSFRAIRGRVAQEILTATTESDLVVLGRRGRGSRRPSPLGSTAREVVRESSRLTLLAEARRPGGGPAVLIYDGSPLAQRALATALAWLKPKDGEMVVLLAAKDERQAEELRREVEDTRGGCPGVTEVASVEELAGGRGLVQRLEELRAELLVLPACGPFADRKLLLEISEATAIPILMMG